MSGIITSNQGRSSGLVKAVAASADFVKLNETLITSSTATIEWVNGTNGVVIDSTYEHYCLMLGAVPVSTGAGAIRLSDDTGSSFETSGYYSNSHRTYQGGGETNQDSTAEFMAFAGDTEDSLAAGMFSCVAWFHRLADPLVLSTGHATSVSRQNTETMNCRTSGAMVAVDSHDGIQFRFNNSSILNASATLYGIK